MVEVFKTNINDKSIANSIVADLNKFFPQGKINFDLEDCDNILRIECDRIQPDKVTEILKGKGYFCEVLM